MGHEWSTSSDQESNESCSSIKVDAAQVGERVVAHVFKYERFDDPGCVRVVDSDGAVIEDTGSKPFSNLLKRCQLEHDQRFRLNALKI